MLTGIVGTFISITLFGFRSVPITRYRVPESPWQSLVFVGHHHQVLLGPAERQHWCCEELSVRGVSMTAWQIDSQNDMVTTIIGLR
jgi:hypothetical protein